MLPNIKNKAININARRRPVRQLTPDAFYLNTLFLRIKTYRTLYLFKIYTIFIFAYNKNA